MFLLLNYSYFYFNFLFRGMNVVKFAEQPYIVRSSLTTMSWLLLRREVLPPLLTCSASSP